MTVAPTLDSPPTPAPPAVTPTGLGRWAAGCYDHRRKVVLVWIVLLIGVTAVSQLVGTRFQNNFTAGNTPSQQAANILDSRFPTRSGDTADVVFRTTAPVTSAHEPGCDCRRGGAAPAIGPRGHRCRSLLLHGRAPGGR